MATQRAESCRSDCDRKEGKRKSRLNTYQEKKAMKKFRRERKAQERKSKEASLCQALDIEQGRRKTVEVELHKQKSINRCFWERWQWEVHSRRKVQSKPISNTRVRQIDPSQLVCPPDEHGTYLGRGSFGVVQLQIFRGMNVAVKEFLPHTSLSDVEHEAEILGRLSHPYLPLLFGVCTLKPPYKIVVQFHGLISHGYGSCTLENAVQKKIFENGEAWITLTGQILEALCYLHEQVHVIHNDLKSNNVLITSSFSDHSSVQIVLIDFGKATRIDEGRKLKLCDKQREEYMLRCPHIAPEVIDGMAKESPSSDIYGAGGIFLRIYDNDCLLSFKESNLEICQKYLNISIKCRSVNIQLRPTAKEALQMYQLLI